MRKTVHDEVGYGIHEVYYDDDGVVTNWTAGSVEPFGETVEELRKELVRMLAATNKPVLDAETGKPVS